MIYLSLLLNFLKIGLFTFGGAYGGIPIIRETVLANGWLSEEQFSYFLAVSESSPGPIMVNMATYIGFEIGSADGILMGILGSALCTLGVVFPAFVVMILITTVLRRFVERPRMRAVLAAIVPAVTGIILATGLWMLLELILRELPVSLGGFDLPSLIVGALLVLAMAGWKLWRRKPMSPILLIAVAAVLGMIFMR